MSKKNKAQAGPANETLPVVAGSQSPAAAGGKVYELHPALAGAGDIPKEMLQGFKQLSLPPIVKPREMPVGAFLMGRLTGIMDSPIKEYKNRILQLQRPSDGFKFCFPMTAVIEKAMGADEAAQDSHVGELILIRKTGVASKGKKGKKPAGLFEVYIKPDEETTRAGRAKQAS